MMNAQAYSLGAFHGYFTRKPAAVGSSSLLAMTVYARQFDPSSEANLGRKLECTDLVSNCSPRAQMALQKSFVDVKICRAVFDNPNKTPPKRSSYFTHFCNISKTRLVDISVRSDWQRAKDCFKHVRPLFVCDFGVRIALKAKESKNQCLTQSRIFLQKEMGDELTRNQSQQPSDSQSWDNYYPQIVRPFVAWVTYFFIRHCWQQRLSKKHYSNSNCENQKKQEKHDPFCVSVGVIFLFPVTNRVRNSCGSLCCIFRSNCFSCFLICLFNFRFCLRCNVVCKVTDSIDEFHGSFGVKVRHYSGEIREYFSYENTSNIFLCFSFYCKGSEVFGINRNKLREPLYNRLGEEWIFRNIFLCANVLVMNGAKKVYDGRNCWGVASSLTNKFCVYICKYIRVIIINFKNLKKFLKRSFNNVNVVVDDCLSSGWGFVRCFKNDIIVNELCKIFTHFQTLLLIKPTTVNSVSVLTTLPAVRKIRFTETLDVNAVGSFSLFSSDCFRQLLKKTTNKITKENFVSGSLKGSNDRVWLNMGVFP